jgi:hypothetical protein
VEEMSGRNEEWNKMRNKGGIRRREVEEMRS